MVSAAGQPHPRLDASAGVACSSASMRASVRTTVRSRPARATSTATGRPPGDDRWSATRPPGATDCGQHQPVTDSQGTGGRYPCGPVVPA